jgi:xylulokinase
MLVGLTASHGRGHVIRADGVEFFSLRDTSRSLRDGCSYSFDSTRRWWSASQLWREIQANVYGRPVGIVEAEEGAAYGPRFCWSGCGSVADRG